MINKTQTKKLIKALEAKGNFDKRMYVGKSGAGLWYIGYKEKDVIGFPDNMFATPEDAIQACANGFKPKEL